MNLSIVVLVVLGLGFAWYRFIYKQGNPEFWRAVSESPDDAFEWFQAEQTCWVMVDPTDPAARPPEPRASFTGPFFLRVPKLGGRAIRVYGRYPAFEDSQTRFLRRPQ